MDIEQLFERTEYLMQNQYSVSITDFFSEDDVRQWLMDSDEPQAIVDEAATKYHLVRRPGTLAYDHIESLVISWRELMVKVMGPKYAATVTDDSIREWLKNGEAPSVESLASVEAEELTEYLKDLAEIIE